TAFVERALPEHDRRTVLRHLAGCASCREVVDLAQPAGVAADTVTSLPPSRSRPAFLRWGALAACAVLVLSFAIFHQRQPGHGPLLAENQAAVQPPPEQRSTPAAAGKPVLGSANQGDAEQGLRN